MNWEMDLESSLAWSGILYSFYLVTLSVQGRQELSSPQTVSSLSKQEVKPLSRHVPHSTVWIHIWDRELESNSLKLTGE